MKKLITFYFRHKKICILMLLVSAVAVLYAAPDIVSAATAEDDANKLIRDINGLFDYLLKLSSAWLWPVILMTGSLLDNDLIFGGAMGERLLNVWIEIRNLVNIVFVFILLITAVYNVLGLGEEGGLPLSFKAVLPKFVLALLAVNFSFMAARVVLDFTNTLTGVVFALPTTTAVENKTDLQNRINTIICETNGSDVPVKNLWCENGKMNEKAKSFFAKLDQSNITLTYALRFGRAVHLKFIRDGLKDLGQLTFNVLFNAVLYVVYAVSFLVLFVVLLGRIVVLWLGVVLSPVIALGIVLPNLKELAGEAGGIKDQFIQNAIAPIKIGLVLSVGYIMLDGLEADKSIHGAILAGSTMTSIDPNSLPTDITDLQQLMIAVAMVVIIWVGVFAAAEKTVAKDITGFIKGNMEGLGKWVAKLPTYAQLIPVGGKKGDKQSLQQLWGGLKGRFTDIQRKGSYVDPYMSASNMKAAADANKPADFIAHLRDNPNALKQTESLNAMRKLMEKQGAPALAGRLKAWGPGDMDKIMAEVYKPEYDSNTFVRDMRTALGTSAGAALANINNDRSAAAATTTDTKGGETKDGEKKPEEKKKSPDEARKELLDGSQTPAAAAKLHGWEEDAVKSLRTLKPNIATALLQNPGTDGRIPPLTKVQVDAFVALSTATTPDAARRAIEQTKPWTALFDRATLSNIVTQSNLDKPIADAALQKINEIRPTPPVTP